MREKAKKPNQIKLSKCGYSLEEWDVEDWKDFHRTLDRFRKRQNRRHRDRAPSHLFAPAPAPR